MEIIEFLANLFLLEDGKSTKIVFKIVKVMLILVLSYILWIKAFNGIITLPLNKDSYFIALWNYVFSGTVLIPLILLTIVLITLYILEKMILPVLIYLIAKLILFPIRLILKKIAKKYSRPTKLVLGIGVEIGFIKIKKNKIKKGFLYNFYRLYIDKFDINEIERQHVKAFCLFVEIMVIWFFLIMKVEALAFKPFLNTIFYALIFLIIYVPINASTHKSINAYKDLFVGLDEITKLKQNNIPNDNNTNS